MKKQTTKSNQKAKQPLITARIDHMVDKEDSNIKAYASVNVAGAFGIHGIKVIDTEKGLFVAMPQNSYTKDGQKQYSDICHPITAEARTELINAVSEAYEQQLNMEESEEMSEDEDEGPVFEQSM